MPNRVIRSGFLDSEKVMKLTEEEQNYFIRLMLVADDYGRFDARPEMLKSHCYPVTDKALSIVSQMTVKLVDTELIQVYEVNRKKYLQIFNFDQRLRQKRIKYPAPPCQADDGQVADNGRPESESESDSELKRNEYETERKGLLREGKQACPQTDVINTENADRDKSILEMKIKHEAERKKALTKEA